MNLRPGSPAILVASVFLLDSLRAGSSVQTSVTAPDIDPQRATFQSAVVRNDRAEVERLLAEGLPVQGVDKEYRTLLHHAARHASAEMADILLRHGAEVHALDKDGNTPLLGARRVEVIQRLLDHGADINAQNNLGNTLLHNVMFHPPAVALLIERGADVNRKNLQGQTPLDIATLAARDDVAAELIRHGADIVGPLHYAAAAGQVEGVKRFLDSGADVNTRDDQGQTVLHTALTSRSATLEMASLLLDRGAHALALNQKQQSPLHLAVRVGRRPDFLGITALLIEAGSDVNAADQDGMSPFLYAVARGGFYQAPWPEYPQMVTLLLDNGAEISKTNTAGRTPLHEASRASGNYEVIRLLLERGLDVNARDRQESTPLHLAAPESSHRAMFVEWRKHPLNAHELIAQRADVNAQDRQGRTPLHIAAQAGRTEIVALLLLSGAQTKLEDNQGNTALALAEAQLARADQRHSPVFQEIVELIRKQAQ